MSLVWFKYPISLSASLCCTRRGVWSLAMRTLVLPRTFTVSRLMAWLLISVLFRFGGWSGSSADAARRYSVLLGGFILDVLTLRRPQDLFVRVFGAQLRTWRPEIWRASPALIIARQSSVALPAPVCAHDARLPVPRLPQYTLPTAHSRYQPSLLVSSPSQWAKVTHWPPEF